MANVIGLSLPLCVKDICDGKVDIRSVSKIYAATLACNTADWLHIVRIYAPLWSDLDHALQVLEELHRSGRIYQPRLAGQSSPDISNGHWVSTSYEHPKQ